MRLKKSIRLLFLVMFLTAAIWPTVRMFSSGHTWIGIVVLLVALFTTYTFWGVNSLPLRFLYPGLLAFLIFTVIPLVYSVYVSITNLSTGHIEQKAEVVKKLAETKVVSDKNTFEYILVPSGDNFRIFAMQDESFYWGVVASGRSQVKLSSTINGRAFTRIYWESMIPKALSKGEIFRKAKDLNLRELDFIIDEQTLRYASTSQLAEIYNQYTVLSENEIKDNTDGLVYVANDETGYFENGEKNLTPGYTTVVGMRNFITLFTSTALKSSFFKVFKWTLVWAFCSVLCSFIVGLFLALLLNDKKIAGKALYRILLIIPYGIPFFISVLVFRGLFNQDFGIFNHILNSMGISSVPWLDHAVWAKASCLIVNLWLSFPYMFLMTTGILQSIPESVYEAAKLEGAGQFFVLRKITLPLIFSAVGPLLIGSFAFNLNNFVSIYLLTGGGPPIVDATTPVGETDILISYTYRMAFEGGGFGQNFGLANSISILIFIIIAIITLINFKLTGMTKERSP